jgi:hypothetical protein
MRRASRGSVHKHKAGCMGVQNKFDRGLYSSYSLLSLDPCPIPSPQMARAARKRFGWDVLAVFDPTIRGSSPWSPHPPFSPRSLFTVLQYEASSLYLPSIALWLHHTFVVTWLESPVFIVIASFVLRSRLIASASGAKSEGPIFAQQRHCCTVLYCVCSSSYGA